MNRDSFDATKPLRGGYLGDPSAVYPEPCGNVVLAVAPRQHSFDDRSVFLVKNNTAGMGTMFHGFPHHADLRRFNSSVSKASSTSS